MSQNIKTRKCPGCKLILPYQENLEHLQKVHFGRYGVASPECLNLLNEVLLKELEFGRPMKSQLDAYAVQHPPHEEIQKSLRINERLIAASKQSVAIHLIALYIMIEKNELANAAVAIDKILSSGVALEKEELIPPANLGNITIADVVKAKTCEEHVNLIWQWSKEAWNAWSVYHEKVRYWYKKYSNLKS